MLVVLTFEAFARVGGRWHFQQEQLVLDSLEEAADVIEDLIRVGTKTAGRDGFNNGEGQIRVAFTVLPVKDEKQILDGMREGARRASKQAAGARYTMEACEAVVEDVLKEEEGGTHEEAT